MRVTGKAPDQRVWCWDNWISFNSERHTVNLPSTGDLDADGVADLHKMLDAAVLLSGMDSAQST